MDCRGEDTARGIVVYEETRQDAIARVEALTLRVLADRLENGEAVPELGYIFLVIA